MLNLFDNAAPVVLAPMSGVTDIPFRRLVRRFGVDLTVTEMVASKAVVRAQRKTLRMAEGHEGESPLTVQIAGRDPNVIADAARIARDRGADMVDINMGCPVKKVVKDEAGAALMRDEILAGRIMERAVRAVDAPVTVKMRMGWDQENRNAPALARIAQESGVAAVTIHGRTRNQFYHGEADWSFIGEVKRAVSIPVIGNGDVVDIDSAIAMLKTSGADGVMIGRGTYGRPWLPAQVRHYLRTGERLPDPSLEERLAIILEHYDAMMEYYGVRSAVRIARKHLGWYSKGLKDSTHFRNRVNREQDPDAVRDALKAFFDPLIEARAA